MYNVPIGPINKDTTIKAMATIGPGKRDSDVVTFSYQVEDPSTTNALKLIPMKCQASRQGAGGIGSEW